MRIDKSTLPRSLAIVGACIGGLQPPNEPFDPNGKWEHRYSMWIVYTARDVPTAQGRKGGALRIRREPGGDGIKIDVNQSIASTDAGKISRTRAIMNCASDKLATPRKWDVKTDILDAKGVPLEFTATGFKGEMDGNLIRRHAKADRSIKAPARFTSDWSLFDAVQRLPVERSQPISFDLFEGMDLHKPDHKLTFRESLDVELGGKKIRLHGFDQIGSGIRPYSYWVDDQHRLLIVAGGMVAYVFDPSAQVIEEKS